MNKKQNILKFFPIVVIVEIRKQKTIWISMKHKKGQINQIKPYLNKQQTKNFFLEVPGRKNTILFQLQTTIQPISFYFIPMYISEPSQLLNKCWKDKNVHIVEKNKSLDNEHFSIIDISLNSQGKNEDIEYVNSKFYRDNIRRGNTIIEYKNKKIQWLRKGTPKMMDITLDYLYYYKNQLELNATDKNICEVIFKNVIDAVQKNKRIQIIKTEKANGQNTQVSYCFHLDAWAISSKNVCLLARKVQDLSKYNEPRYNYAKVMSQAWFNLISKLNADQIQKLKQLLNGYTLIGEYCGNPSYQHLIYYEKISIKWFALIKNDSDQFCCDPFQIKKKIQQFGFDFVKVKSISSTCNIENFIQTLQTLYLKTAEAGIQDQQYGMEGSIVYFVQLGFGPDKKPISKVINAGKLKTLQYRYFRKIRQKLSRYLNRMENQGSLTKKYINECNELQKVNRVRAPYPIDYYKNVLITGYELINKSNISEDYLRGNFVTLLKVIFYMNFKKIHIDKMVKNFMQDKVFLQKVTEISLSKYDGIGCRTKIIYIMHGLPGMLKTYLDKKLQLHFERLSLNYRILTEEKLKKNDNEDKFISNLVEQLNRDEQKQSQIQERILENYFLDGCFDPQTIAKIVKQIKQKGNRNIYHKFILVSDELDKPFQCGYNQYPFKLETIILSYYGVHRKKAKSTILKEKIDNLKIVTEFLHKNANCNLDKMNLQPYSYPFSKNTKITHIHVYQQILDTLLNEENQEKKQKAYEQLVSQLDCLQSAQYLTQQQVEKEAQHLIMSSFPSIPTISVKKF